MFAVVWSVMRDQQLRLAKYMDQKAASDGLQRQLHFTFADGSVCGCATTGLTFDANAAPRSQKLTVPVIRSNCGANPTVVVRENQNFTAGLRVRGIELANLEPNGTPPTTSWKGEWLVHWDTGGGPQIAPVKIPQNFTLTAPSGTPGIAACEPTGTGSAGGTLISSCPTGWVMIGNSARPGTFCIDRYERPARTQQDAIADCASLQASTNGTSHLCSHSEWYAACVQAIATVPGITGNSEWNTEFAGAFNRVVASGAAGCNSTERRERSSPAPYRCCYP